MSGRQGGGGQRGKVLLPPINFLFRLLQQRSMICVWLFEQMSMRIEGKIRSFDEFMNIIIDDAVEVKLATSDKEESRKYLGQILLKGENVCLIQTIDN